MLVGRKPCSARKAWEPGGANVDGSGRRGSRISARFEKTCFRLLTLAHGLIHSQCRLEAVEVLDPLERGECVLVCLCKAHVHLGQAQTVELRFGRAT
jgi:hypothetical protein